MSEAHLELQQLSYRRGDFHLRLDQQLPGASVTALLGASGSGKSTLLNLIAGFLMPDSGDIRWQGQSLLAQPPGQRPITSLFQAHNLFPHLDLRTNIALGIDPGLKLGAAQWQQVDCALANTGLTALAQRYPEQLSGGQQQRAALARCLVRNRPLLLLDEPFSALDPALRREMLSLVGELQQHLSLCVLMVTHFPEDAALWADQLWLMQSGQLCLQGDCKALLQRPPEALRQYLGER